MNTSELAAAFGDDQLILIDDQGQEAGFGTKAECHLGEGHRHRAFSVYLFNDAGEFLLHQRAQDKPLWPMFWTNSCCSHPRRGETILEAAERRVREELGAEVQPEHRFDFEYRAEFEQVGVEHEWCAVLVGRLTGDVSPDPSEIHAWRFVDPDELNQEIERHPERFTPWFKLAWPRVQQDRP